MRKIIIVGLIFILVGCKSRKITGDSSEKFIIENLAAIAEAGNLDEVYTDALVAQGTDLMQEGNSERPFSVLFPETDKEILITWEDQSQTEVYRIMVSKKGTWRSETGIEVGTPYDKLVEINGRPISVYGFGWDYSGAVTWNGGKLKNSDIRVFLAPKGDAPNKFYGDSIIEPTEEEIDSLALTVHTIIYQEG